MLKFISGAFVAITVGAVLVLAKVQDDEEKVPLEKLPAKVTAAVKAAFPGAELVSAEKETEDGTTIYEVAIKDKGTAIEVSLLTEGTIIEIEKLLQEKDLPKAVNATIAAKYAGAKVKKAEEITKVNWEVLLEMGGKTVEVKLDGSGKVVEEETKSGEDKD
jgi:uncharacterized membrane protein YkoI